MIEDLLSYVLFRVGVVVHLHGFVFSQGFWPQVEKQSIANEIFRTTLLHTIHWAAFVPSSLLF